MAHEERLRRNAESKLSAEHDGEPWSSDEIEVLDLWVPGDEDELAALAEMLGRTIEACRQRYYTMRKGHIRTETTYIKLVVGWLVGYCFNCGKFGDVYSDGRVSRCEDCRG